MGFFALLALMFFATNSAQATSALVRDTLSDTEKLFGLSYFWREVTYNFGHKDQVPDLDWDGAYHEYTPRILATRTDLYYYQELQRFCALLKDGHTNIYLPQDIRAARNKLPVRLSYLDGKIVVSEVDTSLAGKLPIGSETLKINGQNVQKYMSEVLIPLISTSAPHPMGQRDSPSSLTCLVVQVRGSPQSGTIIQTGVNSLGVASNRMFLSKRPLMTSAMTGTRY